MERCCTMCCRLDSSRWNVANQFTPTIKFWGKISFPDSSGRTSKDCQLWMRRNKCNKWGSQELVSGYRCNKILEEQHPAISDSWRLLPKQAIFTSTIMTFLNYCRECNVSDTLDRCHNCFQSPYDTVHLFYCPNRPNHLHWVDLWLRLAEVAQFLQLPLPNGIQNNN